MKKAIAITFILIMTICSATAAQAGMVLWYGKKPSHGNWWWQRQEHTPQKVPVFVQSKLKQGYTVYWVFCRDKQCNSAMKAVGDYFYSNKGTLPDWRYKTK